MNRFLDGKVDGHTKPDSILLHSTRATDSTTTTHTSFSATFNIQTQTNIVLHLRLLNEPPDKN